MEGFSNNNKVLLRILFDSDSNLSTLNRKHKRCSLLQHNIVDKSE